MTTAIAAIPVKSKVNESRGLPMPLGIRELLIRELAPEIHKLHQMFGNNSTEIWMRSIMATPRRRAP